MNIIELITESHKVSKEKGFWDADKNHSETVLMIMANVGEIVKANKKKRYANWSAYASDTVGLSEDNISHAGAFKTAFEAHIKDTFEDEMANVILRISDFLGGAHVDVFKTQPWIREYIHLPINEFFLHAQISGKYSGKLSEWLHNALWECAAFSKEGDHGLIHLMCSIGNIVSEKDIDIERHIETKLEYNKNRPRFYEK